MNIEEAKKISGVCEQAGHGKNHFCSDSSNVDMAKSYIEGHSYATKAEREKVGPLIEAVNKLNEHWKIVFPPNTPIAFMSASVHLMTNIQKELSAYKGEE